MIDSLICFKMLQELRACNRKKDREFILQFYADQKEYWYWALDPMINYFVTVSDIELLQLPVGDKPMHPKHLELLQKLSQGYRGGAAKDEVLRALGYLDLQSRSVFFTMLNKRPNCGVSVKTIQSIFPSLLSEFSVQLAQVYKPEMKLFAKGAKWLISPKIDGLRGVFKDGKFYSRLGNEIHGLTNLAKALAEQLPVGVTLDGELTVPGMTFNELSGKIRSFSETKTVQYNVFDYLPSDKSLNNVERINLMNSTLINNTELFTMGVRCVPHSYVSGMDQVDAHYSDFISQGYEGAMLKLADGERYNGRNKDWLKMKPTFTTDVKVVDLEAGTGKYSGAVGALIVDYKGTRVKVGSGLTDKQRKTWRLAPDLIVGKTVEVMYMEETEYGSLRHPRFKTVRGDK